VTVLYCLMECKVTVMYCLMECNVTVLYCLMECNVRVLYSLMEWNVTVLYCLMECKVTVMYCLMECNVTVLYCLSIFVNARRRVHSLKFCITYYLGKSVRLLAALCIISVSSNKSLSFGYLTPIQYAENVPTQNVTQKRTKHKNNELSIFISLFILTRICHVQGRGFAQKTKLSLAGEQLETLRH